MGSRAWLCRARARSRSLARPASLRAHASAELSADEISARRGQVDVGFRTRAYAPVHYRPRAQNPYSDAMAFGVIETVAQWLPTLMKDLKNLEARSRIQLASHMAGVAFGVAGLGICHAVGHPLSAVLHQAHGQTLATMLPHIMAFNQSDPRVAAKYARVARAFGVHRDGRSDQENARAAIGAIADLSIEVGTGRSIVQMGGSADLIPTLVQQALTDTSMRHNLRQPTADELTAMFTAALNNSRLYPGKTMSARL